MHTFSPMNSHHKLINALLSKNSHWRSAYTASKLKVCLTVQPWWIQPLWKYCQSKTHLNLFPTLQIRLAFNSSPPILPPCSLACFQVCLHWELTIILTHPSAQLSFSKLFVFSTITPCHTFPDTTVFSQHYYVLVRKSLPSLLQICTYCSNTKHTPNAHPFFRKKITFQRQRCSDVNKPTADWSGYDARINS